MRGVVLPTEAGGAERWLEITIGDAAVRLLAPPYDPIAEETERLRINKAQDAAEDYGALYELLSPGVAEGLATFDQMTIDASGPIWLAATLGTRVISDWEGALDGDGQPVPFSGQRWQLACFTVPLLARGFLREYFAPVTLEIAAGNGSAPAPHGPSAAGAISATDAGIG